MEEWTLIQAGNGGNLAGFGEEGMGVFQRGKGRDLAGFGEEGMGVFQRIGRFLWRALASYTFSVHFQNWKNKKNEELLTRRYTKNPRKTCVDGRTIKLNHCT